MAIHKNLKYLRNKSLKKQAELAELLGIATNTYSNYENGNRSISIDDAIKLSDYFGISVERLIRDNLWEDTQNIAVNGSIGVLTNHGHIVHNNPTNNGTPLFGDTDTTMASLQQRITDLENQLKDKEETNQAQKQIIALLQKKD